MIRLQALVGIAITLLLSAIASAGMPAVRTAMIFGTKIEIRGVGGAPIQLSVDDHPKSLLVWSRGGGRLAFVEASDHAVGSVIVIDTSGNVLSTVPIDSVFPGEIASGMRYIEALEWLDGEHIAASGSVNPSTTEYDIVDLASEKVAVQFFDDGFGASFSPDGQHYAYVSGSPHFTPGDEQSPTLDVDGKPVWKSKGGRLQFRGPPHWSNDGRAVAIRAGNNVQSVVVWLRDRAQASITRLPTAADSSPSLLWQRSDLYVTAIDKSIAPPAPRLKGWLLSQGGTSGEWRSVPASSIPRGISRAEALRSQLLRKATELGATQADFWCGNCELHTLPRRVSDSGSR